MYLEQIIAFRQHVIKASSNPKFIHHQWLVKWHLEIVERLAKEFLKLYPQADDALVEVMVWLHDYGKILDFNNQYAVTLSAGRKKLTELGFPAEFVEKAASYVEILDKKMEVDLREAPIEVQIVSSADGCSHMVGPFMQIWFYENADKPIEELMASNQKKLQKDWERKIVLPEARAAFEARYKLLLEQNGHLPERFL